MALKDPGPRQLGRLEGSVLIGLTDDGTVKSGEWMWAEFKKGRCTQIVRLSDPQGVKGRFELMLPGDPEPERLMDVRIVATTGFHVEEAEVLTALKQKQILFAGDEAFFIRYSPELLELLPRVLGP